MGKEFNGTSPPTVFVSWNNYPRLDVAPLSITEKDRNARFYDSPEKWFGLEASKIISFRESLIAPYKTFDANEAKNPSAGFSEIQESAMAADALSNEVKLAEKPREHTVSFSEQYTPIGPRARMEKYRLTENPVIPKKADYFFSDTDAKAGDALCELYFGGFETSYLSRILSVGTLGIGKNRKLVPTRWAITATDDTLSKRLIEEKIKGWGGIDCFKIFHSKYLDNDFHILLFPSEWCFEQLEAYLPGGFWSCDSSDATIIADHEFYAGRKDYASNVSGAYYAARLGIAEYLCKEREQGGAIVFREIGKGYDVPLGVWQVRENVRNAMKQKPFEFNSIVEAQDFLSKRLAIPIEKWMSESKLIDRLVHQKRLSDFA